ncbi:COX15/CtaA family protein [Ichthyobacterium seriolicida]|uniref:Cytochrome oxidase assembly protein n=1 Tax=Ichthyobacterium seriolicida TaxID=242600 RepID=A0A1J1DXD0_9FLAO|nr:COX15/CtaA family protein [Ichthyobacterium seriolicida]BAV94514.1 cytochrome oxidase assembly protein [Ichthyobacterium seriolicida]
MKKKFIHSVITTIVLVYIIILSGSIVRVTGSGMGCPDWPKCFGYYIPPTSIEQITWRENTSFKKGNVIIKDKKLYVSNRDFISKENYSHENWSVYTKHNYTKFNAKHTWIEYINRLFGMLAGISTLIMFVLSFFQKKKIMIFLCLLSVILLGFQAWLGAVVVYSVLAPIKISIHMIAALVILSLYLYILHLSVDKKTIIKYDRGFHMGIIVITILLIMQIIFGIQLREFVDKQMKLYEYSNREMWLLNPNIWFYIHRSFSLIFIPILVWIYIKNRTLQNKNIQIVSGLIILEIITGIITYMFDFPILSQPLHLLLATVIFGYLFYELLNYNRVKNNENAIV